MWNEAIKLAVSNGLFAVLFVCLLVFQLKDSAKREKKYQLTIDKLSQHLDLVEDINEDVKQIKEYINSQKVKRSSNGKTEK